jgi:hypothetical protein
MRRILFLDIDGTLSGYEFLKTGKGFIDPACVALLNELEGVDVVISSSWGYDDGKTEKSLRACGLTLPIIGYTEHFYQDWICRGNEIEKWLHDTFGGMGTKYGPCYSDSNYEYAIVDDDCDMLLGQADNFVKADRETGIVKEDIEKIKNILKIKKDE